MYRKSIQKPSESNISKYKNYRNKLNTLLTLAKQNYFSSQLDREKHNMKNTWKILNSILRSSKKLISDKFVANGNIINEPKQIADGFNKYFAIVGFFIFVSTCILEWVFSHLEGMCSNCK